jgi:hypothetical protein
MGLSMPSASQNAFRPSRHWSHPSLAILSDATAISAMIDVHDLRDAGQTWEDRLVK